MRDDKRQEKLLNCLVLGGNGLCTRSNVLLGFEVYKKRLYVVSGKNQINVLLIEYNQLVLGWEGMSGHCFILRFEGQSVLVDATDIPSNWR